MDIWDAQPENVVLEINRFVDPENVKESIKAVKGDPRLFEVYNQHECEIETARC
jgi:hypothetical protein